MFWRRYHFWGEGLDPERRKALRGSRSQVTAGYGLRLGAHEHKARRAEEQEDACVSASLLPEVIASTSDT